MKALVILHIYVIVLVLGAFAGNWTYHGQPLWETLKWYRLADEAAAEAARLREQAP